MIGSHREQLKRYSQLSVALSKATSREQATEMVITLGSSLIGAQAAGMWVAKKNAKLRLSSYIGQTKEYFDACTPYLIQSKDGLAELLFLTDDVFVGNLSHLKDLSHLYIHLQSMAKSCIIAGFKTRSFYGYFLFFSYSRTISSRIKDLLSSSIEEFLHTIEKQHSNHKELPKNEDILRKLMVVQKITSMLSNASTRERVGDIMIKQAFKMINAKVGEVAFIDENDQSFKMIAHVGYSQELINKWPKKYKTNDNYLSSVVSATGKPIFITDPQKIEKKYKTILQIIQTIGIKSLCLIPLIVRNKVIGSINFYYSYPQIFTDFDKRILFLIAHQCAQALDRVIARESLHYSQLDLEKILLKVGEGVVIRDAKGDVVFMNTKAKSLYGMTENDNKNSPANTRKIFSMKDEEGNDVDQKQFEYEKILQKPRIYEKDVCFTWSDGTARWIRIKSFPITWDKSLKHIVDTLQDITDLKQKEQIKEEFISIASHELKTPLTSLTLYLQTLQLSLENKDYENVVDVAERANTQVKRITLLVKDMLDITKMKYGASKLHKKQIVLQQLIQQTIDEIQPTALSHTIALKGHEKGKVMVDKERIRQVLLNLISNAVKYSPNENKVDVTLSQNKHGIKVCVIDFGIGINNEDLKRIFRPFVRAQNNLRIPGIGLGLYIAMEIIKAHKGKIWVESDAQKKQTSFCFQLPLTRE